MHNPYLSLFFFFTCIYCKCAGIRTTQLVCGGSEDTLQKLVLSFHHVGAGDPTQATGLYLLSHLAGLHLPFEVSDCY